MLTSLYTFGRFALAFVDIFAMPDCDDKDDNLLMN